MSRDDPNSGGPEAQPAAAAVTGWLSRARRRRIALAGINGGAIGVTVAALAGVIARLMGAGAAGGWLWVVGGGVLGAVGGAIARRPGLTAVAAGIDRARGARHDEVLLAASFIPSCGGVAPRPGVSGRTGEAAAAVVRATADLLTPLDPARLVPLRVPPGRWALAGVAVIGLGLATGIREPSAGGDSVAAGLTRMRDTIAEIVRRAGGAGAPERVRARAAELRRIIADLETHRMSPPQAEQQALAVAGGSDASGDRSGSGRGDGTPRDGQTAVEAQTSDGIAAKTSNGMAAPSDEERPGTTDVDPGSPQGMSGNPGAEGADAQEQRAREPGEQKRVLEKLSRDSVAEQQLNDAARALANLARQAGGQPGGDQASARGEATRGAAQQPAAPQGEKTGGAPTEKSGGATPSPSSASAQGAAARAFEARAAGTERSAQASAGAPGSERSPGNGQPTATAPTARDGESAGAAQPGAPAGSATSGENATGAGESTARVDMPEREPAKGGGSGIGSGAGTRDDAEAGIPGANSRAGVDREVELAGGAGPSRSEVVETSAARGFAAPPYQRVWGDYQGVVEETLERDAVPPARRQLVREYFHLIRPRTAGRPGATP